MGIPATEVEDQTQLWEILSDMKLTHLAVDVCVLLPSVRDKQKLISSFQRCTNLQALECRCKEYCSSCLSKLVSNCLLVLSYLPILSHCLMDIVP